MFPNSFALWRFPVTCTVIDWCGPHMMPVGRLTFWDCTAEVTWSTPSPRDESACGLRAMRTAYFCDPQTPTSATPSTIDRRWAIVVSAVSSSTDSGSTLEVSAMNMTGAAAGLDRWNVGGRMPVGRYTMAWAMAACTSWAAASILRSTLNWMTRSDEPRSLDDVILSMPAIVENCFSSGVATAAAMVSGLAPGNDANTWIVG